MLAQGQKLRMSAVPSLLVPLLMSILSECPPLREPVASLEELLDQPWEAGEHSAHQLEPSTYCGLSMLSVSQMTPEQRHPLNGS